MQTLSGDGSSLDIYYTHQFVQRETAVNEQAGQRVVFRLIRKPILVGSVEGKVTHGDRSVTFAQNTAGKLNFSEDSYSGTLNGDTGVLTVTLPERVEKSKASVLVNYEFEIK